MTYSQRFSVPSVRLWFAFVLLGLLLVARPVAAQESVPSPDGIWQDADSDVVIASAFDASTVPAKDFRLLSANVQLLTETLNAAPSEGSGAGIELTLPTPDGSYQRFLVEKYNMMDEELAAALPQVQTYAGIGIDDPNATIRLDLTSDGFHGLVRSSDGIYFIEPIAGDDEHYAAFDQVDTDREVFSEVV